MLNKKAFLLIVCFLLLSGSRAVYAKQFDNSAFENYPLPSSINTNHTDGTWGETNNGLIAKIWTETKEFRVGEPIIIYYIVKNISDKEITTWHSGFWPNHLIIVIAPDGNKVTSNELGLTFHPGVYSKNAPFPIKPDGIDTALSSYDLTRFFDMREPGMYTVQYLYEEEFQDDSHWKGKLLSNILKIRIK